MRLFHGSAQFDAIMREGLRPQHEITNDFSEDFRLASLGGIYLTDNPEVAAFYADIAVHSEQSFGLDPCMFEVEVDQRTLIADEDKVWGAIQELVLQHLGVDAYAEGLEDEEVHQLFDDNSRTFDILARRLANLLHLEKAGSDGDDIIEGALRAFALRSLSYEWEPGGRHTASVNAINKLCSLCTHTLDKAWLLKHFDGASLTTRTLEPIAPIEVSEGQRIVGYIRLALSVDGLSVTGADYGGSFTAEQVEDFQRSFIERNRDRGAVIEPLDMSCFSSPKI